jgi:hypothetical protein
MPVLQYDSSRKISWCGLTFETALQNFSRYARCASVSRSDAMKRRFFLRSRGGAGLAAPSFGSLESSRESAGAWRALPPFHRASLLPIVRAASRCFPGWAKSYPRLGAAVARRPFRDSAEASDLPSPRRSTRFPRSLHMFDPPHATARSLAEPGLGSSSSRVPGDQVGSILSTGSWVSQTEE